MSKAEKKGVIQGKLPVISINKFEQALQKSGCEVYMRRGSPCAKYGGKEVRIGGEAKTVIHQHMVAVCKNLGLNVDILRRNIN